MQEMLRGFALLLAYFVPCAAAALLSVALLPGSQLSMLLDMVGSVIVAAYLVWCGAKTIYERMKA